MNEERFIKAEADPTTLLIAERLGERKKKLDRMAEMENGMQTGKGKRRNLLILSSVAACVLAALLVWPIYRAQMSPIDRLGIETPSMTEFRSANAEFAEISSLVERKDYDLALQKTRKALAQSDMAVRELDGIGMDCDNEEMAYEEELEKSANSELRWTYIYLLVRLNHNDEARKQLKIYMKNRQFCGHSAEAMALLEELK